MFPQTAVVGAIWRRKNMTDSSTISPAWMIALTPWRALAAPCVRGPWVSESTPISIVSSFLLCEDTGWFVLRGLSAVLFYGFFEFWQEEEDEAGDQ